MAEILSCVSQKGGVGKSTLAICLSLALADLGQKVLLVDLDPQHSLSKFFFDADDAPDKGLVEFVTQADFEAISPCRYEKIELIVNNDVNKELDDWMLNTFAGSFALKNNIAKINVQYDIIIIDTQGSDSRGKSHEMALAAANTILTPTTPDMMSSQELPTMLEIYEGLVIGLQSMGMSSDSYPALKILINRADTTTETKNVTAAIRNTYGSLAPKISVLKTVVPQRNVYKKLISEKKPPHLLERDRTDVRGATIVLENIVHELFPHLNDLSL